MPDHLHDAGRTFPDPLDRIDATRKRDRENGPPILHPYICTECAARNTTIVCDRCLGACVPVRETPNGQDDRLAAEGLA